MRHPISPEFRRVERLGPILMKILPIMMAKVGFTMIKIKNSKHYPDQRFRFRLKECNPKIEFLVDCFGVEMDVSLRNENMDSLICFAIPWVFEKDGQYFAHWTALKHCGGAHASIERLMGCYLPKQIRDWRRKLLPDTVIHIHELEGGGCTWARLVNSMRPAGSGDKKCLIAEQRFWNSNQEEP